nr:MAG TPA: hypothetical protein [Caudoviricetes sp.]
MFGSVLLFFSCFSNKLYSDLVVFCYFFLIYPINSTGVGKL